MTTFFTSDQHFGHRNIQLGTSVRVSIPRYGEINEMTAEAIFKAAGEELGKEWWR